MGMIHYGCAALHHRSSIASPPLPQNDAMNFLIFSSIAQHHENQCAMWCSVFCHAAAWRWPPQTQMHSVCKAWHDTRPHCHTPQGDITTLTTPSQGDATRWIQTISKSNVLPQYICSTFFSEQHGHCNFHSLNQYKMNPWEATGNVQNYVTVKPISIESRVDFLTNLRNYNPLDKILQFYSSDHWNMFTVLTAENKAKVSLMAATFFQLNSLSIAIRPGFISWSGEAIRKNRG